MLGVVLLGVALSMDSVFVGVSYGLRGTKVPLASCAVILLFSTLYAGVAVLSGSFLKTLLDGRIIRLAGALLLAGLGTNMIVKACGKDKAEKKRGPGLKNIVDISSEVYKNPNVGDVNLSGDIDVREAFFLTLALSADALAAGVAGGMLSLSLWLFPLVTGVFQTAFLCLGMLLGKLCKKRMKRHDRYVSLAAGIALIVFAVLKLL